jgi:hypothetical protein
VHHVVLIALLVFAVAVAAGLVAATVQGLAAWRAFRRFRRTTGSRLAETVTAIGRLEARAASAGESLARLDRARKTLQKSLALLSVMTGGTREAWSLVGLVRGFMPRK